MDWSSIFPFLQSDLFRNILAALGGLASLATIGAAVHRAWRWWKGADPRHRRAARALRTAGWHHHRLRHRSTALELYDLSIQLNPRAGYVYCLRGLLREENGELNKAIADWERCIARLPTCQEAHDKLAHYNRNPGHRVGMLRLRPAHYATVLIAILALLFAGIAYAQSAPAESPPSKAKEYLTDAAIALVIIAASISTYKAAGKPCACPEDIMRNGRKCGGNSAWSRRGGDKPLCYVGDIDASMIRDYRAMKKIPSLR